LAISGKSRQQPTQRPDASTWQMPTQGDGTSDSGRELSMDCVYDVAQQTYVFIPQRQPTTAKVIHQMQLIKDLLLASFAFAVTTTGVSAQDAWPKFRGPSGNGHAAETANPPVSWSTDENITWRVEIPGSGWSSPVVRDGRIYLTAGIPNEQNSEDLDLSLLILNADSGELLKQATLIEQSVDKTPKIHSKNTHASPTPIIEGDRLYIHFGYQGTVCTDLNGEVRWTNRELYFRPIHGNGGSPVLVEDRLIFTCDGSSDPKVVALHADTGKLAWQRPRPVDATKKFSFCTPAVIDFKGSKQVIVPGSDCVLALDPTNGDVIWDVRYDGYSVVPKPIFESGKVFVSTGFDRAKLLAIDPAGSGVVTDSHVPWMLDKNVSKTPSMIGHAGLVYVVSDNGVAMCIEADSGDVVYQKRLGGNYSASPVLAANRIYFTSETGVTTVVAVGRDFEKLAENDLTERTLASMAVVGNAIIMRTASALYRIEQ
jgi:outer membrane protein assembly factor BamB